MKFALVASSFVGNAFPMAVGDVVSVAMDEVLLVVRSFLGKCSIQLFG